METKKVNSKEELLNECTAYSQKCRVSKLFDQFTNWMSNSKDKYEMKQIEVTHFENSKTIMIFLEQGLKNDEGTLAQAFGRTAVHFSITARAKVQYTDHKDNKFKTLGRDKLIGTLICAYSI